MKIGLFSDLHCGREELTNKNRYPSRSLWKLQKLLTALENEGVDLAICLGDVINGSVSKADDIEHLCRVAKVIRENNIPVLVMQGNHDFRNISDEEFYGVTDFVQPPFVCRADEVNLIFLDANYSSDGTRYGSEGEHPDWTDSNIPQEQIEAMRDILANAPEGSRFWVLCHQCLDIGVEERHIVRNAGEVLSVIAEEGKNSVEFVICGHYHPGAYSIDIGTEFITLPAVCTGKDFNPDAALILDTAHKSKKEIRF